MGSFFMRTANTLIRLGGCPGSSESSLGVQVIFCQFLSQKLHLSYGPGHAKTCLMPYANNKGADQPAHPGSLISTFVVRCLDSMICILAISKVSRF